MIRKGCVLLMVVITLSAIFATPVLAANAKFVKATAGAGGTIDPVGKSELAENDTKTFTIMPDTAGGFHIKKIVVDGKPATVTDNAAPFALAIPYDGKNHTIKALFARNIYPVEIRTNTGGIVTPKMTKVVHGKKNLQFTVKPKKGYEIFEVRFNGVSQGKKSKIALAEVLGPVLVEAFFIDPDAPGLPPDPGQAGNATIAGVDTDGDGLRDDVQRYLSVAHGESPESLNTLKTEATSVQEMMKGGQTESELANMIQDRLMAIIKLAKTAGYTEAEKATVDLMSKMLNTPERLKAYLDAQARLSGMIIKLPRVATVSKLSLSPSCSSTGYSVIYINGIRTSPEKAGWTKDRLESLIGSSVDGEEINYDIAYNQSRTFTEDVFEVILQKKQENPDVALEDLVKLFLYGVTSQSFSPYLLADEEEFVEKQMEKALHNVQDDFAEIVETIRQKAYSDGVANQKVLLVAHSQGNLYANAAYKAITTGEHQLPPASIKIFGLASPADHVEGDGLYVTSKSDMVIKGLAEVAPVLEAHEDIPYRPWIDFSGHDVLDTYLKETYVTTASTVDKMKNLMRTLEEPGMSGSQGPITVTLTWGSQPDVDLHIIEPTGTHVYYQNMFGDVGNLDIDDTSSYGPEHYYTSCTNLLPGNYLIGVNYFSGYAPETAKLVIDTPIGMFSRQVSLPVAYGSNGDNNFSNVGKVTVEQENGRYRYSYTPL